MSVLGMPRQWIASISHNLLSGISTYALIVIGFGTWIVILASFPLFSIWLDEKLDPLVNRASARLGGFEIPLRYLLGVALISERNRTLDRWLRHKLPYARDQFEKLKTCSERELYIDTIVDYDNRVISPPYKDWASILCRRGSILQPLPPTRFWVTGEGGTGKTSIALQAARFTMRGDLSSTKAHGLLPVLIEDVPSNNDTDPLVNLVRSCLCTLLPYNQAISKRLATNLLQAGRLLVIIDGLSELTPDAIKLLDVASVDFMATKVVVTSRYECNFTSSGTWLKVRALKLTGKHLPEFMSGYLRSARPAFKFTNNQITYTWQKFATILRGCDCTILLAKLFADQQIASFESGLDTENNPHSVPDIMSRYITSLAGKVANTAFTSPDVLRAARIIAWECVRASYAPRKTSLEKVRNALEEFPNPDSVIAYLESPLNVLQIIGYERETVRFVLDPLAEYLAAMFVVKQKRNDEDSWMELIDDLKEKVGKRTPDNGFLLALIDSSNVRRDEEGIPGSVIQVLNEAMIVDETLRSPLDISPSGIITEEWTVAAAVKEIGLSNGRLTGFLMRSSTPRSSLESTFYEIGGVRIPASVPGGCYYDFFKFSEDKIGIVLCDGLAKGLRGVMATLGLRAVVVGAAYSGAEPDRIVKAAKQYATNKRLSNQGTTMFFGMLSSNGRLDYAIHGRSHSYWMNNKGEVSTLERVEMAPQRFGIAASKVRFSKGDSLFLASAGLAGLVVQEQDAQVPRLFSRHKGLTMDQALAALGNLAELEGSRSDEDSVCAVARFL